ncbi:MAG: ribonuclease Y, partial [Candidatus Methylomirabilales bacterium]
GAGYLFQKRLIQRRLKEAEEEARRIVSEAERAAETRRKEAELQAKERILQGKAELERESRERRRELLELSRRLSYREEALERRERGLSAKEREAAEVEAKATALLQEARLRLELVAGMTAEEAKRTLIQSLEDEARREAMTLMKRIEEEVRENAKRKAQEIIATAIERCAAEFVQEAVISVVNLPNDEVKGRIIGREGRNIRTFQRLTGVDLIVDDTPEAVILSAFDPIRREVARIALEHLIADGRIHPTRIEEAVERARQEVEEGIREAGEQACFELGIVGMHPELVRLVGRLKYRYSYGQSQLQHAKEVARLAGIMAAELGLDPEVVKRAGLLHDIGKAADGNLEGTHTEIAVELAKKYKEPEKVINAIASHHEGEEVRCLEAVLLQAADALSAARPGARQGLLEAYVKRLEKLEQIASSFEGVSKAYAIQAGREIRIIVEGKEVSDEEAYRLAREMAKRIEQELTYPGRIKVTVIRETRAVEYAK